MSASATQGGHNNNYRTKDVLPNINRTQAAEITPPTATEWSYLLLHDVTCIDRVPFRRCLGVMGVNSAFCPW